MPEIDGVNVVPSEDDPQYRITKLEGALTQAGNSRELWRARATTAERRLERVHNVAKELEKNRNTAPIAVLIEGALER